MLPLLVMINNYFHDLATAVLLGSAVVMWVLLRVYESDPSPGAASFLVRAYKPITRLALGALIWILVGGIPRTIFFARYEWWDAAGKGILVALAVKHVLLFTAVAAGAIWWRRLSVRVAELRSASADAEPERVMAGS